MAHQTIDRRMARGTAEVIAVGDEMIGGDRLDTNTQWLASQLSELGVQVLFHTTVGDDLARQTAVFRTAAERAAIVVVSGGLGPTADDLTRQVLAEVAGVELVEHLPSREHIESLFRRYGREMPESNRLQAYFPRGSRPIPNREGTAPGIDATVVRTGHESRFFCLPGVPYEMKEMWQHDVAPQIMSLLGGPRCTTTRVLNCFGAGESHIEAALGDLIARGREPTVGITASHATISLRIVARGDSPEACRQQIEPIVTFIHERLGDLVFGEGEATLEEVVCDLLQSRGETVAVSDRGLCGNIGAALAAVNVTTSPADPRAEGPLETNKPLDSSPVELLQVALTLPSRSFESLSRDRERLQQMSSAAWHIVVGPLDFSEDPPALSAMIVSPVGECQELSYRYAGHTSLRRARAVKFILNEFRRFLHRTAAV